MKTVAAIVVSVVLLYVLYSLRHALLLIYFAVVLAIMFDPAVRLAGRLRIGRWHPNRGLSVALVALFVIAIVVLIVLLIVPPVLADAARMEQDWPRQSQRVLGWIHGHLPFSRSVTADTIRQQFSRVTGGAPFWTIGTSAIDALTTLLIAVYLLVDGVRAFDWMLSLLPAHVVPRLRSTLTRGAHHMQRWTAGQGLLMLTHGGSAFVTFGLLKLPYFAALATFAAVINIIPFLGPILTLVAAGLVAAIEAPGKLLGVVIFYLAYHNAEGAFLQPRIMSSAVGVPAVAVIVALLIGDEVAGIAGMVFSVPTAVLIAEIKNEYLGSSPRSAHPVREHRVRVDRGSTAR